MAKRKNNRTAPVTMQDDAFGAMVSKAPVVDPMSANRGINYLEGMDDEGLRDIARVDAAQLSAENQAKIEKIQEKRSAREAGTTQYGQPVPETAKRFIDRNQTQRGRKTAASIARRPGETASSHMARIAGTEGAELSQLEAEERNYRASQDFNRRKAAYDAVIAAGLRSWTPPRGERLRSTCRTTRWRHVLASPACLPAELTPSTGRIPSRRRASTRTLETSLSPKARRSRLKSESVGSRNARRETKRLDDAAFRGVLSVGPESSA